jgi:hypothetical protein
MGFFSNRFPYTDFNKINLDWIMRELKKLAPTADLVEQSAAALEQAQQTASAAQQTANDAAAAVDTVTTQAAEAVATAEEAKEIAQQAASATIADGSVTMPKLAEPVQDAISGAGTTAAAAQAAAAAAQTTAENAGSDAALALVNAENARQLAVSADSKADAADTKATVAQNAASTASTNANAALAAAQGAAQMYNAGGFNNNGRNYTLSGSTLGMYLVFLGSTYGTDHSTIYFVDAVNNRIRLLGNRADAITPTITNGVLRLVSNNTEWTNVWIMPLK